ncbi:MAG: type I glyceraldehyde-3-phosphate dehydrogenase [Bacteroidetes bacterium]|nr:type I glyceraldehyde-3-phosphate dehydrogenase [Bacteroidota bacterium]
MAKIKVAINGFGRIGRVFTRIAQGNDNIDIVAINDLTDTRTLAHLYKYDSVHGVSKPAVSHTDNGIIIDGKEIRVHAEKSPDKLTWHEYGIDVVLESTGHFLDRESAELHLKAGARKVILSAPPKSSDIKTVVLGVNDAILDGTETLLSNASCTTNCAAPMIKVLHDKWQIVDAYINTVHAYTGDQRLHDAPHKDLRRARAAAHSIIPTTTGAAKAITKIFPDLEGKIGGSGMRVPVLDGSITEITCLLDRPATIEEINAAFKQAADGALKGYLEYTEDPIVSADIVGNGASCIFDAQLTSVVGNMVKVLGWYDNEYGYSSRLVDLVERIGR